MKKPPISRRLRISDIRKCATNTIAELRIYAPDPAAPLRIWLIRTLIVSKRARKSIAKGVISEFSARLGVYPGRLFVFGETKKSAEADSFVVP